MSDCSRCGASWGLPKGMATGKLCTYCDSLVNRVIMRCYTSDCAIQGQDLAEELGLSLSTLYQRVRRLRKSGHLRAFHERL